MKNTIIGSLLFGAVVFAAANVNAQTISDKLTVTGVVTEQTTNTVSGGVTTFHTKARAFNTRSLITLLNASPAFQAANSSNSIPVNAWFTYDGASVWATNKTGFSANLSALLDSQATPVPFATANFGSSVFTGHRFNDATKGGGNEQDIDSNISFTIQDGNGTSVVVSGLGSEHFVWGAANASGNFHQNQSFNVTGGGPASYLGNSSAISRGTVSGVGSGTLTTGL
jgi:hypothetical protein